MRVLSWDVGIINLAYCLIDMNMDTKKYKIINWEVINLTDRDKMKCFHCNLNPSYYQEINNKYSCKNHSKLLNTIAPDFETTFIEDNTSTCCFVGKTECGKKSKYVSNELYYCNVHAKSKYKSICNEYKLVSHSKKGIATLSMDDFKFKLVEELEKRANLLQVDFVVIENQPSLKNPRMKTIAGTVYDYYMIRGMFDKNITKSTIESVKFMSPSNKLKLASDGDTKTLVRLKGDDAKTYKLTKQLGVKYCLEMIQELPEWLKVFSTHKKKDDMADCFLQGMYALTAL